MDVKLMRTVVDHDAGRRCNIYRRADGGFWVLVTPTNPDLATAENVYDVTLPTRSDALAYCDAQFTTD